MINTSLRKDNSKYLGYASRTKPVTVRYCSDLGFMAVSVTAFVTSITKQKQFLIVPFPTELAVLVEMPRIQIQIRPLKR